MECGISEEIRFVVFNNISNSATPDSSSIASITAKTIAFENQKALQKQGLAEKIISFRG